MIRWNTQMLLNSIQNNVCSSGQSVLPGMFFSTYTPFIGAYPGCKVTAFDQM